MANGTYIPVSGLTDANGSLLALQGIVSDPSLLVPPALEGFSSAVELNDTNVSAELLASVGFPGLAVSGQSDVVYWVSDLLATHEVPSQEQSSPVSSWIFGAGVRLGIRGISVKGNAATSVPLLAASATLNGTAASFQLDTIGVGFPIMSLLTGLIDQSLSGFDLTTYQEMMNVVNDLTTFLAEHAENVTPQIVGVIFATGPQVQNAATSYGWALRGIQNGLAGQQLADKAPKDLPAGVTLDPAVVGAVYANIVGSESAEPSSVNKSLAHQLTHSGP